MFFNINCLIAATYFWFIYCQAIQCFGKNCYYFGGPAGWHMARNYCKFHGDLATIHSNEEHDFIAGNVYCSHCRRAWIGLTKETWGDYRWVDGSAVDYVPFRSESFLTVTNSHSMRSYAAITLGDDLNDNGDWEIHIAETEIAPLCKTTTTDLPTFYTSHGTMNFDDAKEYCTSTGGQLASIRSAEESGFIYRHIQRGWGHGHFWIGLTKVGSKFEWLDGSDVSFTKWYLGKTPSHSVSAVIMTGLSGYWDVSSTLPYTVRYALCRRNGADEFTGVPRSPTLQPSHSPTETERCSLGLKACKSFYQKRLEVSLTNKMYENCKSNCVYDYDKMIDNREGGFKYSKNRNCYDYVKKGGCFKGKTYLKAMSVITSRALKKEAC